MESVVVLNFKVGPRFARLCAKGSWVKEWGHVHRLDSVSRINPAKKIKREGGVHELHKPPPQSAPPTGQVSSAFDAPVSILIRITE